MAKEKLINTLPISRKITSQREMQNIANKGRIICRVLTTNEMEYCFYNGKPYIHNLEEDTYSEINPINPLIDFTKENIAAWLGWTYQLVIPIKDSYIPFGENSKVITTYICGNTEEEVFRSFYGKLQNLIPRDNHSLHFIDDTYSKSFKDYVSLNSL